MLTPKNVLDFIRFYVHKHGFSPSIRDISEEFSCSTSTVNSLLKELREQGYVTFEDGKRRTLRLCEDKK